MKLYDLISNLKFVGIKNYKEVDIDALSCDSHEKLHDGMYFCIKGTKSDGHDYARESINNGAKCLVVEHFVDEDVPQILVENTREAMSYICSIFNETYKSKMKFVGITGTNGKTTTTFLIRDILRKMNKKVGLIGTEGIYINNLSLPANLTTPDPIVLHKTIHEMEQNGCEYCVMEVSAHAIALKKIDNIYYDVVGLSNITKDHLDFFLNMENYMKCKASLFDYKHAKTGVINTDAKYGKEIAKKSNIEILTAGKEGELKLLNVNHTLDGTDFSFEYNGEKHTAHTNLMGDYNVANIMMAIGVLLKLGMNLNEILGIINKNEFFVPGRFNVLNLDADFKVVVDYAHTPDGIKNILSAIEELPVKNIITVFGCGGNRDKTKRSEMGEVATLLSDYVIVTSDNPRYENPDMIIDDIFRNNTGKNMVRITDRREAIETALNMAQPNDIVVILGKGAENYQEVRGIKNHFSDYEIVEEYFNRAKVSELKA